MATNTMSLRHAYASRQLSAMIHNQRGGVPITNVVNLLAGRT
jgi:hypothetical protein